MGARCAHTSVFACESCSPCSTWNAMCSKKGEEQHRVSRNAEGQGFPGVPREQLLYQVPQTRLSSGSGRDR